jgi:hypothetical protein
MANLQPVHLQDEDGTTYTIFVETTAPEVLLPSGRRAEPEIWAKNRR